MIIGFMGVVAGIALWRETDRLALWAMLAAAAAAIGFSVFAFLKGETAFALGFGLFGVVGIIGMAVFGRKLVKEGHSDVN